MCSGSICGVVIALGQFLRRQDRFLGVECIDSIGHLSSSSLCYRTSIARSVRGVLGEC